MISPSASGAGFAAVFSYAIIIVTAVFSVGQIPLLFWTLGLPGLCFYEALQDKKGCAWRSLFHYLNITAMYLEPWTESMLHCLQISWQKPRGLQVIWGLLGLGVLFGGLHTMHYSIFGLKLGPPDFGKLPNSSQFPYAWLQLHRLAVRRQF